MNLIGIRTICQQETNLVISFNTTPQPTGLSVVRGLENARTKIRAWIPITVDPLSGVRVQVSTGANLGFIATVKLYNAVAQTMTIAVLPTTGSIFSNSVPNAGDHWLEVEAFIDHGPANSFVSILMSQSIIVPGFSTTVKRGATMDVLIH